LLDCLELRDKDLSILFTDNRKISQLNKKCFGKDYPTNVISFSYLDGFQSEILGDIVVSVERAKEEADHAGLPFYQRLVQLIIHGLTHIIGYDHEKGQAEARRMRYREKKLFAFISESDAYAELVL
jgi:rRNA maturation RNase YbeY